MVLLILILDLLQHNDSCELLIISPHDFWDLPFILGIDFIQFGHIVFLEGSTDVFIELKTELGMSDLLRNLEKYSFAHKSIYLD